MLLELKDFDIAQIAASGQCFRMENPAPGLYTVPAFGRFLEVEALPGSEGAYRFSCSEEEFDRFWKGYFDLDTDYGAVKESIPEDDPCLRRAAMAGGGIRILRQELWEMLISFLISQRNNIPRIRRCIRLICEAWGKPLTASGVYAFPTPEALAEADEKALLACNLGYRARYVLAAARAVSEGALPLEPLAAMGYQEAKEALLRFYGVGEKVADCICLFSLHHLEAFPVDTHIRQVLEREYPQGFPFSRYGESAGIMQQYLFYYELLRSHGKTEG